MKNPGSPAVRLGLALWLAAGGIAALAADSPANDEFTHTVPFELGRTQFAPGDTITI